VRQRKGRQPKYLKIAGSRTALFNADALKRDAVAVVTGGEFDCLLTQQHAAPGVVSLTFGSETKKPSPRWLLALRCARRVLVVYHADAEGKRGALRWKEALPRAEVAGVPVLADGDKDITDYWRRGGHVAGWLYGITGIPRWVPPQDKAERVTLANLLESQLTAGQLDEAAEAQALARWHVCGGIEISASGDSWMALAQ